MSDHRREKNQTSKSYHSFPLDEAMNDLSANIELFSTLSEAEDSQEPRSHADLGEIEAQLHHMLSIHASSPAAESPSPAREVSSATWIRIGAGACGAIFARDGKSEIAKISKMDGDDLWNDFRQHVKISGSLKNFPVRQLEIPSCMGFIPEGHDFMEAHPKLIECASTVLNFPAPVLISQRINPLPKLIRELLIAKFCRSELQQAARNDPANKDCLVRLYLGSQSSPRPSRFFSLRNFKLHLDQMDMLKLDIRGFAYSIGQALAVMHWAAQTDARDIEFVLGSSTVPTAPQFSEIKDLKEPTFFGPASGVIEDFYHHRAQLYLLDFNQVRDINLNETGAEAAFQAFKINDPYFPRPLQTTPIGLRAWDSFAAGYLTSAQDILGAKGLTWLATSFLTKVLDHERARREREG